MTEIPKEVPPEYRDQFIMEILTTGFSTIRIPTKTGESKMKKPKVENKVSGDFSTYTKAELKDVIKCHEKFIKEKMDLIKSYKLAIKLAKKQLRALSKAKPTSRKKKAKQ